MKHKMRLFLALRPNAKMKKTLTSLQRALKQHGVTGNFSPEKNLHLTLVFFGETEREKEIKDIISSISVPVIKMTPIGLARYKNVLVLEVKANQALHDYVDSLRKALDAAGINFDHKAFKPHITLVRKARGDYSDIEILKYIMTDSHVSLMKSERRSSADGKYKGMIYTEIAGWER